MTWNDGQIYAERADGSIEAINLRIKPWDTTYKLRFKRLTKFATLPTRAHPDDAGLDLYASEHLDVPSKGSGSVSTGLSVAIPSGYVGLIHPRSGVASRASVTVLNSPGTIDAGYRGELKILLVNHGDETFRVRTGDRVAQLLIQKVELVEPVWVDELDDTERGAGGFGSTDVV